MSALVIPHQYLRQALLLLHQQPGAAVWSPLGACDSDFDRLWLAGPVQASPGARAEVRNGAPVVPRLRIQGTTEPPGQGTSYPGPTDSHPAPALELVLGMGERRGQLWLRRGPAVPLVESVMLVGPGMHRIPVPATVSSSDAEDEVAPIAVRLRAALPVDSPRFRQRFADDDLQGGQVGLERSVPNDFVGRLGLGVLRRLSASALSRSPRMRWSRTMGGLGGEAVWRRLCQLRIAVIGCGRSGSVLADMLAGAGSQRLVLIDPDLLEEHNLGEMAGVLSEQVGLAKVEALAEHLRRHGSTDLELQHLAEPLWSPAALRAAKGCDVLCVAADHDAARLTAAIFSTLYHKVLLDCATGIQFPTPSSANSSSLTAPLPRIMGADVRLIVPGDGCLLCRGNLTNYTDAVETLCRQPMLTPAPSDWRRQRAGSLRSLNTNAAAQAVRLLEDLVAERVTGSVWAHLEFDPAGRTSVTYPAHSSSVSCVLCAKAGLGDAGLEWG